MPELPEVEITRLGILKRVGGRRCTGAVVRETRFRKSAPANLSELLTGQCLRSIERRGKYLIWNFDRGYIVSHLGMSGVMRIVDPKVTEPVKQDHIDILFGDLAVRYHDPRRFGFVIWLPESQDPYALPEIAKLGEEPFSDSFTVSRLRSALANTSLPIKEAMLTGKYVVGVGNIYCSESLFKARISPLTPANKISKQRLERLVTAIREVLTLSLNEGGSTLKDFVSAEGEQGYFTLNAKVYGKEGKPCANCGRPIKKIIQNGRATYYCSNCQRR